MDIHGFSVRSESGFADLQGARPLAAIGGPEGLNGMGYPQIRPVQTQMSADLQQAADVAGEDRRGSRGEEVPRLALAQLLRHLRLGEVVTAGRAAAKFTLGQRHQLQARDQLQQLPRRLPNFLGMAQTTGIVVRRLNWQRVFRLNRTQRDKELANVADLRLELLPDGG